MAVRLRVQHLNHSGGVISTHTPVGGSLSWGYKANEVGTIAYVLAQSELEELGVEADSFAPYKTDYRLQIQHNGSWTGLQGGIHVPVSLDTDSDAVSVAGKDWAHWLEQPVWFDWYNYNWDQAGDTHITRRRDVIKASHATPANVIVDNIAILAFGPGVPEKTIIQTLIDKSKQGPNFVDITTAFLGTAGSNSLEVQAYIISFQDTTSILQHINNIAAMDDPYGFDWTMNTTKKMEFFGPRKQVESSPVRIWTINKTTDIEQPLLNMNWANNGPVGTHIVGLSIGSPALWYHKTDQQSVEKYRKWLKLENVGDQYIMSPDLQYAVDGLQYMYPQKDIKITVIPELLNPYDSSDGFRNHIGDVVRVTWGFPPYHTVDAYYWITEQSFSGDASGNWKCDLGLQQIYDVTQRTSGGV